MATASGSSLGGIANDDLRDWEHLVRRVKVTVDDAVQKEEADGVKFDHNIFARDPFIRAPASSGDIRQMEAALQTTLPDDYKAFLQVTDGVGWTGISRIPSLCGVKQLEWAQVEDVGLDDLRLDTFPPNVTSLEKTISLTADEFGKAPSLKRVLKISDEDEETIIFFIEPEYVRKTWLWLAEKRGIKAKDAPGQWLVFFFVPWAASTKVFSSFEEYMRSRVKTTTA
ncbi:hypothetical protein V8C35DRAFT_113653 [Trichoderma chlorosporum]